MTTPIPGSRFSRDQLERLLGKMAGRRVVVVGDAMLDIYLSGDAERISPEAPVPVVTVHTRRYALGGAANVAANVAAIGAECRLVAVIGDDARGDSLRSELAQTHLPDRHVVVAAERPTTSKTRVTARGQQLVRIDQFGGDNSFYRNGTKKLTITFGKGGVDDAEDAEVIVHEYGHAVHAAQVFGFGSSHEAGSIGEAWGDYLSVSVSPTGASWSRRWAPRSTWPIPTPCPPRSTSSAWTTCS